MSSTFKTAGTYEYYCEPHQVRSASHWSCCWCHFWHKTCCSAHEIDAQPQLHGAIADHLTLELTSNVLSPPGRVLA